MPARTSATRPASPSRAPGEALIRLDSLVNPYGPSLRVFDALAGIDDLHSPAEQAEEVLRQRLAAGHRVPPGSIMLANGMDDLLTTLLLWWRDHGTPVILFPPADPSQERHAAIHGVETTSVHRGENFRLELDPSLAAELPPESLAIVDSPNDPTGSVLGAQEAVRLARACRVVAVDERHVEYGARTLLPLVREFENVLVLRTMETWAGLSWLPLAYAVGPPGLIERIAAFRPSATVARGALVAAEATLDDLPYVQATVRRVREERSRLYRSLRKLNMVRPFPSWGNFLLARIERGGRDFVVRELGRRGVVVACPPHPELSAYVRISATRPDQTDALRRALIELAADL
jgi:histidinol-phosphate aminotransferase